MYTIGKILKKQVLLKLVVTLETEISQNIFVLGIFYKHITNKFADIIFFYSLNYSPIYKIFVYTLFRTPYLTLS